MSIHVVVGLVPVKRFDHEGLHQLQNCFVTDEHSINLKILFSVHIAVVSVH